MKRWQIALAILIVLLVGFAAIQTIPTTNHSGSISMTRPATTTSTTSIRTTSISSSTQETTSTLTTSTTTLPALFTTTGLVNASGLEPTCSGLNDSQLAANREVAGSGPLGAFYDTQLWLNFANNSTSLSFDVVATPQYDSYGFGPGMMVDGATPSGYWYQVGLVYNWWNYGGNSYAPGFEMFYQVWNISSEQAVYPSSNGATLPVPFASLKAGDTVTLSLAFNQGGVVMEASDLNSSETIVKSYTAFGATYFQGGEKSPGYPTSLLVEWPHVLPYLCLNDEVSFRPTQGKISSGWLQEDTWNFTGYPPSEWWDSSVSGEFFLYTPWQPFSLPSTSELFYLNYLGPGIYATSESFTTM